MQGALDEHSLRFELNCWPSHDLALLVANEGKRSEPEQACIRERLATQVASTRSTSWVPRTNTSLDLQLYCLSSCAFRGVSHERGRAERARAGVLLGLATFCAQKASQSRVPRTRVCDLRATLARRATQRGPKTPRDQTFQDFGPITERIGPNLHKGCGEGSRHKHTHTHTHSHS